jgi:osmotically-inducible protein OsmY
MRRNVVFGKGRGWRAEDDRYRELHLGPRRGAAAGEYAAQESSQYSDSYYDPGGRYARRGNERGGYPRDQESSLGDWVPGDWNADDPSASIADEYGGSAYGPAAYAAPVARDELDAERASTIKARAYRGLGPRGYRRSDERIREDVCEALTDDPRLDASGLEFEVKDGEVTLSGNVGSRQDKRHAERVAEMITGVRDVHNRLRFGIAESDLDKGEPSSPMAPQDLTS